MDQTQHQLITINVIDIAANDSIISMKTEPLNKTAANGVLSNDTDEMTNND